MHNHSSFNLSISGVNDEECRIAIDHTLKLLVDKLPEKTMQLINNSKIKIADGLIDSGGQTNAEAKEIILDTSKNKLSLDQAEDLLVSAGYLNAGDWLKALPDSSGEPWSCLSYQLVHEVGHLIDGLSEGDKYNRLKPKNSPTKYGQTSPTEAFAEAFSYWVFDLDLKAKTKKVVTGVVIG